MNKPPDEIAALYRIVRMELATRRIEHAKRSERDDVGALKLPAMSEYVTALAGTGAAVAPETGTGAADVTGSDAGVAEASEAAGALDALGLGAVATSSDTDGTGSGVPSELTGEPTTAGVSVADAAVWLDFEHPVESSSHVAATSIDPTLRTIIVGPSLTPRRPASVHEPTQARPKSLGQI